MNGYPTGTISFIFTDIEGSTSLWEKHPEAMKAALSKHDSLLRSIFLIHNGIVIKATGDGFHAVFKTATDAVHAAIHSQQAIQKDTWGEAVIKVRMGIHTGEAELRGGDYYGSTLNRAARIMSIGHGGQILLSETTFQITREHLPSDVTVLDLGEHKLKGLSQIEKIYQISTPELHLEFPALKSLTHTTNNLPTQLSSFIGRTHELNEAQRKLASARLLTLIGPGGTGKTRLSLQVAEAQLDNFKDGVWLVELAPITDPSLITQTIATTFDVREAPGVPIKTLLHDFLREKHLLLILDNCEHLVEDSARVADEFLHTAPNIKIIASSREALGINGETVYRVPSLSLPNQAKVTKEAAMGFESVQLFVERASAANPKFQLTDENASFIAQICSRLDGIPLAIELSASRITVFSPEQIAKRLDDRFKLLTGGSRTALPRQQTLRALIDWSYELLSEDERALLRRLSVFAGGWTFEAAETICNNVDVFDHLPQLVNKSLVTVKDDGDEPRYFLLETIRQYARDKLLENGEGAGTRDRHLAYFLEMTEIAQPEILKKEKELGWINRLQMEYDNIRTAIEWSLSNDPLAAARIVYSLSSLMVVLSSAGEGHRWGEKALKEIDDTGRNKTDEEKLIRARLLVSMGIMSFAMGDNKTSRSEAREAFPKLRELGDKRNLVIAMGFLCGASILTGHQDESIKVFEEALALAEELGDEYILGTVLLAGSRVEVFAKGDFSKAIEYLSRASELLNEHGNRWSYGVSMFGFGNLYMVQRDFEKSREKYKIAMQTMQELGSARNVIMIKSDLAHILRYEENYSEAIPAYRETLMDWQRMGHRAAIAHQLESLAFIAKAMEQTERAARLFGSAEALRQKIEIDMTAQEREEYDKEVADLKANMDAKDFASLWAEGRSMTMDEALELALS